MHYSLCIHPWPYLAFPWLIFLRNSLQNTHHTIYFRKLTKKKSTKLLSHKTKCSMNRSHIFTAKSFFIQPLPLLLPDFFCGVLYPGIIESFGCYGNTREREWRIKVRKNLYKPKSYSLWKSRKMYITARVIIIVTIIMHLSDLSHCSQCEIESSFRE